MGGGPQGKGDLEGADKVDRKMVFVLISVKLDIKLKIVVGVIYCSPICYC